MVQKIELKYRTFDQLMADVMVDFTNYSLENLIEPQQLIKIAKKVSKDLGLKIYTPKETILELDHFRAKLPDDFYVFNSGLLCGEYTTCVIPDQGVHMEEVPYPIPLYKDNANVIDTCGPELCAVPEKSCGGCGNCTECTTEAIVVPGFNPLIPYGDRCVKPRVFMDCKGASWELIQIVQTQQRTYKHFMPVRLRSAEGHLVARDCPNHNIRCADEVWLKDGFLESNMRHGKIYMSYEGMLEDENGNLLVLDHDIINLYYEWALKTKILENLWFNGEDVERKLAYAKGELRTAKIEAITIARMPDFKEMQEVFRANRRIYKARYVDMFVAYNWFW